MLRSSRNVRDGFGVALAKMLGGPGTVLVGIVVGIVDEAELDGVDVELFGELVHGDFEDGGAGGFAGRAHVGGDADVHVDHGGRGRVGVAGVEHARGQDDGLEEVFHDGGGHGDVVLDGGEFAVWRSGEADAVDGGGAAADGAEHLRTREGELHGLLHDAGGHRAEDDVRPGGALGAETRRRHRGS